MTDRFGYSLTRLRELRELALVLGFMDDVAHWDRLIREAQRDQIKCRVAVDATS